jgi:serine protease Do
MPDPLRSSVLRAFRDELVELADTVADSVVTVRLGTAELGGGTGSGWFIEPGVIVTNHHVVDGDAPSVKVRLRGGKLVAAQIVGTDRSTDIAVLRCDESDTRPIEVADRSARAGELCFAFGSPLGEFTESVTFGIVSGLGRRLMLPDGRSIENVLQTDAEINPGNSGGPLVDLDGDVLGVNTAIRTDGRGVGFAVPAETVLSIVPELLEYGEVIRPRLGVALEVIEHWDNGVQLERLRVASAPADHALRTGDVLLAVADRPIVNRADLFAVMRRPLLGVDTPVEIERNGEAGRVTVTAGT